MRQMFKSLLVNLGLMVYFWPLSSYRGVSSVYEGLSNNPFLVLFSLMGLFIFFKKVDQLKFKTNWVQKLVTLIFTVCTWLSTVYKSSLQTVNKLLVDNPIGLFYSLLYLVAFFILIDSFQKILTAWYYNDTTFTIKLSKGFSKILDYFKRKTFIFSFLFLVVIYSLIALSTYPGVFMGDSFDQIMQFLGYADKAAAHPVLSTIFIGTCVKLGLLLGSGNLGVFIFTITQLVILSLAIAFALKLLSDQINNKQYVFFSLLLFSFLPSIQGTILLATKDILYSAFFLLFFTTLIIYFYDNEYFFKNKLMFVYFVSLALMMLFRYNTLYFVVLMLIIYVIGAFFMKINIFSFKTIIPLTLIALVSGALINSILVNQFVEVQPKPNRREMLSLPFQHTARFIWYHENEVSEADKEIINSVLNYNVIRVEYNPYRSDPVKRTHDEEATTAELIAYFKLVLKQAYAHPLLAFESVAVSHSNLFNINISMNDYYNTSLLMDEDRPQMLALYDELGLKEIPLVLKINKIRVALYRLWDRTPILSQLNNYGTFIFLLFAMFAIYLRDKKYTYAAILIPVLAFLATLIAGPVTIGYIRYILPIIFSVIIMFGFFINTHEKRITD